jgi:hypothetical protein
MPADELIGAAQTALGPRSARLAQLVDDTRGHIARARERSEPAPALTPRPMPSLSPPRPVQLVLPDGRNVRVALNPAAGERADLARLRRVSADNDRRAFQAIARLEASQRDLERKVADLEAQRDVGLARLFDRFAGLNRRVDRVQTVQTRESTSVRTLVARQRLAMRTQLRARAAAARVQQLNGVASSMQVAAFGQKGDLFAKNNLALAGNQLLWGLIEPLLRGFGVGWLAPLGNLAVAQNTLGRQQHIRFVTGRAVFAPGVQQVQLSLRDQIAPALRPIFQRRTDVPVLLLDGPFAVDPFDSESGVARLTADVRGGLLSISMNRRLARTVQVRFQVDTGVGDG